MASIRGVSIALPEHEYTAEEILHGVDRWFADDTDSQELFERFIQSSETRKRYYSLSIQEILSLHDVEERARLFRTRGLELARAATASCLERCDLFASEIQ